MNSQQCIELAALCRSIRWDVDMAAYSTFRTGGVVEAMVEVSWDRGIVAAVAMAPSGAGAMARNWWRF